jgi:hypothetical protein
MGIGLTYYKAPVTLRASKVPSSRIGRLFHYGCESRSKFARNGRAYLIQLLPRHFQWAQRLNPSDGRLEAEDRAAFS